MAEQPTPTPQAIPAAAPLQPEAANVLPSEPANSTTIADPAPNTTQPEASSEAAAVKPDEPQAPTTTTTSAPSEEKAPEATPAATEKPIEGAEKPVEDVAVPTTGDDVAATTSDTPAPANDTVVPANDSAVPANDSTVHANDKTVVANDSGVPANDATVVPVNSATVVPANNTTVPANENAVPTTEPATEKTPEVVETPLAKLKAQLPEILKEADLTPAEATTGIWGVSLDPSATSKAQDVILEKFLVAREQDVVAAKIQLVNTLKWRKEFKALETVSESFPEDLFGTLGKILPGRTKNGEPVTLNLYGEVKDQNAVFGDLDRFIRWRVGLMEKGIALLDFTSGPTQMVQIHDYAGVSLFGRDPASKQAASKASQIFSDYYPELLSSKYFVNVPGWAAFLFKIFSSFLSARTLAKFTVIGPNKTELYKAFSPIIPDEALPERYGGKATEA